MAYPQRFRTANKDDKIEKAIARKEQGIKDYTSQQEISIATTSAMRDATLWCVNHPNWKANLIDEERWAWIDETARKFLNFYATKRQLFSDLYVSLKGRQREVLEKEITASELDIDADNQEEIDGRPDTRPSTAI